MAQAPPVVPSSAATYRLPFLDSRTLTWPRPYRPAPINNPMGPYDVTTPSAHSPPFPMDAYNIPRSSSLAPTVNGHPRPLYANPSAYQPLSSSPHISDLSPTGGAPTYHEDPVARTPHTTTHMDYYGSSLGSVPNSTAYYPSFYERERGYSLPNTLNGMPSHRFRPAPNPRAGELPPPLLDNPPFENPQAPSAVMAQAQTFTPEQRQMQLQIAQFRQQPTYVGLVRTTAEAIKLLTACDLPDNTPNNPPRRIPRRLLDSERAALVRSGNVFVWDEQETGIRRWTDGRVWSASRVHGGFLTYRELLVRKHRSGAPGCPTQNKYKVDGLIKQSFTMTTTSGRKMHIISYYHKRDLRDRALRRIDDDDRFSNARGDGWPIHVNEEEYPDPDLQFQQEQGVTDGTELERNIPSPHEASDEYMRDPSRKRPYDQAVIQPTSSSPLEDYRTLTPIDPAPFKAIESSSMTGFVNGYPVSGYAPLPLPRSSFMAPTHDTPWCDPNAASGTAKRIRMDSTGSTTYLPYNTLSRPSNASNTTGTMRSSLSGSSSGETVPVNAGYEADRFSRRQSLLATSSWSSQSTLVDASFPPTDEGAGSTKPDQTAAGALLSLAKDDGPRMPLSAPYHAGPVQAFA